MINFNYITYFTKKLNRYVCRLKKSDQTVYSVWVSVSSSGGGLATSLLIIDGGADPSAALDITEFTVFIFKFIAAHLFIISPPRRRIFGSTRPLQGTLVAERSVLSEPFWKLSNKFIASPSTTQADLWCMNIGQLQNRLISSHSGDSGLVKRVELVQVAWEWISGNFFYECGLEARIQYVSHKDVQAVVSEYSNSFLRILFANGWSETGALSKWRNIFCHTKKRQEIVGYRVALKRWHAWILLDGPKLLQADPILVTK